MAKAVGIGHQNFEYIIEHDLFYVDKTMFIKEWWEYGDAVTLITRPRRFGKTLAMSMTEHFFPLNLQEEAACLKACQYGRKKNTAGSRGLCR